MNSPEDQAQKSPVPLKKPYTKPTLVIYGPLQTLARSTAGSATDAFGQSVHGPSSQKKTAPKA
jgi:hypothetical protein